MNRYKVTFKVFRDSKDHYIRKEIEVEAGAKKLAVMRAMGIINKDTEMKNQFKEVESVEKL